jgi:hypothetical protein
MTPGIPSAIGPASGACWREAVWRGTSVRTVAVGLTGASRRDAALPAVASRAAVTTRQRALGGRANVVAAGIAGRRLPWCLSGTGSGLTGVKTLDDAVLSVRVSAGITLRAGLDVARRVGSAGTGWLPVAPAWVAVEAAAASVTRRIATSCGVVIASRIAGCR